MGSLPQLWPPAQKILQEADLTTMALNESVTASEALESIESEEIPGQGLRQSYCTSCTSTSSQVQKVWCAPMSEAGEWVVTWTGVSGARGYEVQTSADSSQWTNDSRFSGTRAVLLLGPAQRCWVRVRAIGPGGPGAWSPPASGKR